MLTDAAEATESIVVHEPSQLVGPSNGTCWPVVAGHAALFANVDEDVHDPMVGEQLHAAHCTSVGC
jgi:hypothetical protein